MKNSLLLAFSGLTVFFVSCGPAAEDREMMHRRAKVFQDSIANVIRVSMDQAAEPSQARVAMAVPSATGAVQTTVTPNPTNVSKNISTQVQTKPKGTPNSK